MDLARHFTSTLILIFLISGTFCAPIGAKEKEPAEKVYNSPVETVYAAVVQVASARYNLKTAVKEAYTVNFFTGGDFSLVLSATCHDHGGGQTIVTLSVQRSERDRQLFFMGKAYDDARRHFWNNLESALHIDEKLDIRERPVPQIARDSQTQQPQSNATVTIASTPPGAEISVDQNFVGNTPSSIAVSAGSHMVSLRKQGYKDWNRSLVVSGGNVNLDAELVPGQNAVPPTPSSTEPTRAVAPAIISPRSEKGWIGLVTTTGQTGDVKVAEVQAGSPAANAGLKVGDVIANIGEKDIKSSESLETEITRCKPGTQIQVRFVRGAWASDTLVTVGHQRD